MHSTILPKYSCNKASTPGRYFSEIAGSTATRLKKIIALLLFISITGTGISQTNKRICVMGSSTAYGYFGNPPIYDRDSGWVAKIREYYMNLGIVDTVYNIAESGTDCYSGMPTSFVPPAGRNLPLDGANITAAINKVPRPDVIIVNYPTNNYQWLNFDEIINCLQTIKDSANANNIECYITTTQPRDDFSATSGERQRLKDLKALIESTFGAYAIDFWTDVVDDPPLVIDPNYALGDGVHLNPTGHTVLETKVIEKNMFLLPLAVNFGKFYLQALTDRIVLNWNTIGEYDNQKFIVQRSTDGSNFNTLGMIQGARNTAQVITYSYTDIHPANGNNYYRIQAVSSSNKLNYSAIALGRFNQPGMQASAIYPSITRDKLSVLFHTDKSRNIAITVTDMESRKIFSKELSVDDNFIYSLNTSAFPAGNFVMIIDWGESKEVHRFVKY